MGQKNERTAFPPSPFFTILPSSDKGTHLHAIQGRCDPKVIPKLPGGRFSFFGRKKKMFHFSLFSFCGESFIFSFSFILFSFLSFFHFFIFSFSRGPPGRTPGAPWADPGGPLDGPPGPWADRRWFALGARRFARAAQVVVVFACASTRSSFCACGASGRRFRACVYVFVVLRVRHKWSSFSPVRRSVRRFCRRVLLFLLVRVRVLFARNFPQNPG